MPDPAPSKQHVFQPPSGTRDLYPIEASRRRYITEAWRRVSINHGFEEIDGPTFEHLDLYKVKSGEGIVSELFSFTRAGGEKDYALRPEFTPTLARMYAAKAASLPKPTKWFSVGPYFRAERPQRGRLREFLQWNCDVIGLAGDPKAPEDIALAKAQADAEVIASAVELLRACGLTPNDVSVRLSDRTVAASILRGLGVDGEDRLQGAMMLLDRIGKLEPAEAERQANAAGFSLHRYRDQAASIEQHFAAGVRSLRTGTIGGPTTHAFDLAQLELLRQSLDGAGLAQWCRLDLNIARGLAYYTGMVFEVIVDNERAVAGGGRYDNLIELYGGPSTPAVGFGMGDIVLSMILDEKGLLGQGGKLSWENSRPPAAAYPEVFVISDGAEASNAVLSAVIADLRQIEPYDSVRMKRWLGLHVRRSYKATKNPKKMIEDAIRCSSSFVVIVEQGQQAVIKNLEEKGADTTVPLDKLKERLARLLGR